jgi:hypothetical protein
MRLDLEFSDGRVRARAEASIITPIDQAQSVLTSRRRARRSSGGGPGQGSLF